jgi:hypothetical protein
VIEGGGMRDVNIEGDEHAGETVTGHREEMDGIGLDGIDESNEPDDADDEVAR